MSKVLAVLEQRDGTLRKVSFEVVTAARRLSAEVDAVVCGSPGPEGCATAVAERAKSGGYGALVFAATATGKDLAPRVAAKLGVGVAADVTDLAVEGDAIVATRPVYAGKARQRVTFTGTPAMVSLRPKVFAAAPAQNGGAPAVTALPVDFDLAASRARVREVRATSAGKVDLTEAEIIVSGGRGLQGPEHFDIIEALAAALGATVGASRAVVDAGWRPHGDQVGQTGKTVSPKLYVAVAISGAIQHLAGMSSSRCIVAINKDPEAPIFKVADYGLVGDAFEVVPALTEAVKQLNAHV